MIALFLAAAMIAPPAESRPPISLADAKRVMAAAEAEAAKRHVSATIVIVDRYGELVLVQTAVDAEGAAFDEALTQARSIINYGAGAQASPVGSRAVAVGLPLISGGTIIGAIGDAGVATNAVAKAGTEVLK